MKNVSWGSVSGLALVAYAALSACSAESPAGGSSLEDDKVAAPTGLDDLTRPGPDATAASFPSSLGQYIVLGNAAIWHAESGPNYWIARDKDPNQDAWGAAAGVAEASSGAGYIFAHGKPGWMEGLPPKDVARSLYENNGQQLVIASCFGGVESGPANNAGKLADVLQLPREKIFGCTGYIGAWRKKMYCDGHWVDGNGTALTDEVRSKLSLQNCNFAVDPQKLETVSTPDEVDATCR